MGVGEKAKEPLMVKGKSGRNPSPDNSLFQKGVGKRNHAAS